MEVSRLRFLGEKTSSILREHDEEHKIKEGKFQIHFRSSFNFTQLLMRIGSQIYLQNLLKIKQYKTAVKGNF